MKIDNLTIEQRSVAIQRVTALWAFSESGLGGVLHGLQIPFTGLVVGGLAIVLITLISLLSRHRHKQIFKSLVVVLLVKAAVSPHTPFPAYIAVSFQAVLGYGLFRLLHINFISILLLSVVAMLESAIQKLLILTLFFGKSFWKAADELVRFIGQQFSVPIANGSGLMVVVYLSIYIGGGILTALMAYKLAKTFSWEEQPLPAPVPVTHTSVSRKQPAHGKKILLLLSASVLISAVLFFFSSKAHSMASLLTPFVWTLTAILFWYGIIAPALTRALQSVLRKTGSRYGQQVEQTLNFLPVLHQLAIVAWRESKQASVAGRGPLFITILLRSTLLYKEPGPVA